MRKWTIHIYIVALLVSLLASCISMPDEETILTQDKAGITFTLSMNSVGAVSRGFSSDMATQYENTIDQDQFRVLAYTTDGKVHEVSIFLMEKISDGTYKISGELKGGLAVNKLVILANCDGSFDPFVSSLNLLTYGYSGNDFNPESPKSYIPMWGVKKITTALEPGTSTDIGTINLLRAMAKIQVALSEGSIGCELTQVTMTRYNSKGACVPSSFESMDETADVEEATIPGGVTTVANFNFFKMDDNGYVLYLPEYKNKGSQYLAGVSVNVIDVNGVKHSKTIVLGKYSSGVFANEHWDILRNHYYRFNILLNVAADGNLNLEVKTEKYAEFELKPVYGDDPEEVEKEFYGKK